MKLFKITVKGTPTDFDDIQDKPMGEHLIEAANEEAALDEFHSTVAIACLDDFTIESSEVTK